MYFLRRRHGRKPPTEARRDTPPAVLPPTYHDPEPDPQLPPEPARPVVITKTKRQRVAEAAEEDFKPAGTFRAGTLHIPGSRQSQQGAGKQ